VPTIIEKCLAEIERRGLEEVGIYRVSGAAADVSRLRQLFNVDPDAVDLSADEFYDINVVSGVTKQFLRELPEPLMTYNLYEGFVNAASIDDYDERLWAIKDLVHALPTANYTVLKRLVEHLERVTDYEEINHMYGTNLALVFGPSLLRPPPGS
ncbi:RhoGAP-domain-containing protein, partial [Martensiomyces pterosporus]